MGALRPQAREAALGALEAEVLNEKVESLARAGRQVERALAVLRGFDGERGSAAHEALLDAAAAKVWGFIVQRELCGFRNSAMIVEDFTIPREVMARLGIVRKR
ncbi:hypothetical protein D3876_17015 [Sphingomonas cavernae]|uniref:Uncharacterized protein n=1 Tax=Sphingomonas cavernae TaxID=2320861 RepID=A0A418W829_9SPHN|nr:hypothetical protein D3876_17015 [Sphingomonas cavernae]